MYRFWITNFFQTSVLFETNKFNHGVTLEAVAGAIAPVAPLNSALPMCVKWHGVLEGCRKISKLIVLIHKTGERSEWTNYQLSFCQASQEGWMPRCRESNWTKVGRYPMRFSPRPQHCRRISTLQKIFEKSWEHAKDLYRCFVDLGTVYGLCCRVLRKKLCGVLWEYGVDGYLLLAVKSLYSCSEDCVRVRKVKSRPFSVGVRLNYYVYMVSFSLSRYHIWITSDLVLNVICYTPIHLPFQSSHKSI